MSAIAGIYHFNNGPVSIEHSRRIMQCLQKYPADDVQIWQKDNIFLGCHAQWITAESIGEQLPYYDYERQLAITADAIIDNRKELFNLLQIDRQEQKEITDSKLILLAYDKWGENVPKQLDGDFAFMIWDEKEKKLFGARDFSGSRTLYYYHDFEHFSFCTTIEPLLSLPYVKKELNEEWLAEYLAIPNMIDTANSSLSVIKGITQLSPSHSISIRQGKTSISRYSMLVKEKDIKYKSDQEYIEAFQEVFQRAVDDRLRTFRSVGSQLSGGLDSGSVVSFAAKSLRKENKELQTYSYVPEESFHDWTPKHRIANERPFINSTIDYVRNIKPNFLDCKNSDPLSEIDDWLEAMEMPYKFFENSVWVKETYKQAYQQGVGVLLNGARGNFTISWGPALDYYSNLLRKMKLMHLYNELQLFSSYRGISNKSQLVSIIGKKAFPTLLKAWKKEELYHLPELINSDFAKEIDVYSKLKKHGINHLENSKPTMYEARKKHFVDVANWNVTGTMGTKLSLRYSLWNRDPTNDKRLIQFCLNLPAGQFVKDGLDRALIRRATEGFLPDKVRLNQKVRGIQGTDWVHRMVPVWAMFITELEELVEDPIITKYINIIVIKDSILKFRENPQPEWAFDPELRILMRSLIVYRFLKNLNLKGGEVHEESMARTGIGSIEC